MELIGTPPLILVAEFALANIGSFKAFDAQTSFEWIERQLINKLYFRLEEETVNINDVPYDPYAGFQHRPVNDFIQSLNEEPHLTRFNLFTQDLANKFLYYYGNLPFPEQFSDLSPFYEFSIDLLNADTAILKITEKEDVEFFTELIY